MIPLQALPIRQVEKVWGRTQLPAPFTAPENKRIGEIWFEPQQPCEGLLAKYLFTSEKLSVQVHPSDAQAPSGESGKEECWLVLDADPGATLAIGFRDKIDKEAMREAALDGSIEGLLEWHPVKRGDFFYLPAGTVHAIGPGISLVEIQQNSDITYRLYDYGRPRDLHLDEALAVAQGTPYDTQWKRSVDFHQTCRLVDGPYFTLDYVVGPPSPDLLARYSGTILVMPLEGSAQLGGNQIDAGQCGIATDVAQVQFSENGRSLLVQEMG